ncbi:hypothetical protein P378_17810 [Desulforamulus profundi]|uniref:Uncharacterized protein n=1 Tax=Desulforamulus profundi TaxID=1383067 RepID=A0A2C6MD48_9FIRM|nr:hypothetical protein P378_17810 [Desulforamulus profundi]
MLVAAGAFTGPVKSVDQRENRCCPGLLCRFLGLRNGRGFMTSAELALSGIPFAVVLPAMLGVHALIGIGEGVITAAVVLAVLNAGFSPNWLRKGDVCSE